MNIQEMSITEIKAICFDIMQQQQVNQKNLEVLYAELQRRANQPPQPTPDNTIDLGSTKAQQ
jgi:hypothetical protein